MSQFFRIHPDDPQPRLVRQAAEIVRGGGVIALPTDSSYALACHLDDKDAVERVRRIRGLDDKQHLSLLVRDLSELATFAMVDNRQYRLIKSVTPGPYVFILQATKEVPRRLSHPSRKTIGLRVPAHAITLALLAAAVAMLVFGTRELKWGNVELAAFYAFVAIAAAAIGGLDSRSAADAFVDGMKSMMLAALLMGLAASVELLLQNSLVLDTLIHLFTRLANGQSPVWVANGLMAVQMVLDVFIPSVSGKAAVSMPIIGPIAQLSGVSGQTSVLAFVLGGGLTNLVTPTSGMLLAYLATARVDFGAWLRFVLPLFAVLLALSCGVLAFAVQIGY